MLIFYTLYRFCSKINHFLERKKNCPMQIQSRLNNFSNKKFHADPIYAWMVKSEFWKFKIVNKIFSEKTVQYCRFCCSYIVHKNKLKFQRIECWDKPGWTVQVEQNYYKTTLEIHVFYSNHFSFQFSNYMLRIRLRWESMILLFQI